MSDVSYTLKDFAKYNKIKSLVINNKKQVTIRSDDTKKVDYYKDIYNKSKAIVKSFGKLNMDNIKTDIKDGAYELSLNYWELTEDEQEYIAKAKNKWYKIVYPDIDIDIDTDKLICLIMVIIEILVIIFVFKQFGYNLGVGLLTIIYPLLLVEAWFLGMPRR